MVVLFLGRTARVTFSYNAEDEDELTLKVGDIIENIADWETGWWDGELNGKKGVFPNNFVEELTGCDSGEKLTSLCTCTFSL